MDILETWKTVKRADLLQMYYYLRLTRTLEDRITALYRQGRIVGGVYTGNGMEAIAVGYASALERDDIIAPLHRDSPDGTARCCRPAPAPRRSRRRSPPSRCRYRPRRRSGPAGTAR